MSGGVDVSVLVPTLNEEAYVVSAAERMFAQTFDGEIEFIFIDGDSDDGTPQLLEELAAKDPRVRVLRNPQRQTAIALNIGLREARGEFVVRMDAHTHYPPEYIAAGVARLRQGGVAWVSGPQIAVGVDKWSRRVALALSTRLGTGGARFRRMMEDEVDVDSGFTGIWRRSELESFGGWDERWPVDQDYELAARMLKAGRRVICIPEMAAEYVPRNSLRRLGRQYWRYGLYRAKTSGVHPESMRRSHVLPPGLALTLVASVAGPGRLRPLARAGLGLYAGVLAMVTGGVARRASVPDVASLPLVLPTMHLTTGFGFLWGCVRFGPPVKAVIGLLSRRSDPPS